MLIIIAIYILMLALSLYFSGSEVAYISINKEKYQFDIEHKHKGALSISKFVKDINLVLLVTLFGNNLANIVANSMGSYFWKKELGEGSIVIFTFCSTILFLIFGDIIPKITFKRNPNQVLYNLGTTINFFYILFKPFIFFLEKIFNFLELFFNFFKKKKISKNDIDHIIDFSHDAGLFSNNELGFVQRISSLSNTRAVEIMKPLVDLVVLHKEQKVEDIFIQNNTEQIDFFPVYENRIDNIIGYIDVIDLFNSNKKNKKAKDFLKKNYYVPENITLDKLYSRFSEHATNIFIVVDEYGGCSGLVTEKDVVDRIFGFGYYLNNISKAKKRSEKRLINKTDKNTYEIDTLFDIDEFNQLFKVAIAKEGFETLGGFVNHLFSKIPKEGESKKWKNLTFKILKGSRKAVDLVEVVRK